MTRMVHRRRPSPPMPSDRVSEFPGSPRVSAKHIDTFALLCRELTTEERAEETALVRRRVGRVHLRDADHTELAALRAALDDDVDVVVLRDVDHTECAALRSHLLSMLLGED